MYIPTQIKKSVQVVASSTKAKIIDNGKVLSMNNKVFLITSVTANGIMIEDIENDTIVDTLIPWEKIA